MMSIGMLLAVGSIVGLEVRCHRAVDLLLAAKAEVGGTQPALDVTETQTVY